MFLIICENKFYVLQMLVLKIYGLQSETIAKMIVVMFCVIGNFLCYTIGFRNVVFLNGCYDGAKLEK